MGLKNKKQDLVFIEKLAIKTGEGQVEKFGLKQYLRLTIGIIFCCLVLITLGGCFAGSAPNNNQTTTNESLSKDQSSTDGASSVPLPAEAANANALFDISKIIYAGNISLNTDNYQTTFDKISAYATGLGGFVQDSGSNYVSQDQNIPANSGFINIRVPSEKFSEAMTEIQKFGNPISSSVNSTNISQQYEDAQAKLNNLKIEEGRLLEYLKQATNVTDMLAIETELNRVRTEIDSLSTTIKNWDKEIAYSTIYVSLYEKKLSGSTLNSPFSEIITKIGEGFITSVNIILYVISFLIVLIFRVLPFAAIAGLGFLIFIQIRKKIKQKNKNIGKNSQEKNNQEENSQEEKQ